MQATEQADATVDTPVAEPISPTDLLADLKAMTEIDSADVAHLTTSYLIPALIAILVLIFGYFFAKFVSRILSSPIRKRVDETLGRFAGKFVFYSIMAAICLGVLAKVGVPVGGFAALVAAAGFAVGLAFQGTLSNFAAGVLMLVFRPFKVGDVVSAAGVTGKVNEIDLFTVTIDTPDNRRIIVPNSAIAAGTIENVSFHPHRRVDVPVGVDYSADLETTRRVLSEAAEAMQPQLVQGEGRGYAIVLSELGGSSVDWVVRFWTRSPDFFAVKESLTSEIKVRLDSANIGIPYPTMDINVVSSEDNAPEESRITRPRPRHV